MREGAEWAGFWVVLLLGPTQRRKRSGLFVHSGQKIKEKERERQNRLFQIILEKEKYLQKFK